jgi:hypothetical protein
LVGCLVWLISFVSLIVYRLCKILKNIIQKLKKIDQITTSFQ